MGQQQTLTVTRDNYSDTVLCSKIAFEQLQKCLAETLPKALGWEIKTNKPQQQDESLRLTPSFSLQKKRSCVIDLKVNWDRDHFSFSGPYNAQ